MSSPTTKEKIFSRYEVFVIAVLSILQFTVILDFMVLSPLGAQLMKELSITTGQFSLVVSAYAISAGISGLLAAGFADKFDRKKLLLFFYTGFVGGTFLCGIAPDYQFLLIARIVTGIFGGVIGSISFAIITDLFKMEVRGRVMGFVQMAFATSQVMGIPAGLYFANISDWHAPFIMIVGLSVVVGIIIIIYLKPINKHLSIQSKTSPLAHFSSIVSQPKYLKGFAATTLLATGGFMLMPFGSAFVVHNLGIAREKLFIIYMITGVFSMISGPLIGKFSDKLGKYTMFVMGTVLSIVMVIIYCNMGITPIWLVIVLNSIMFMGINSSVQQISGGIASGIAGLIVVQQTKESPLEHYDTLAYVVTGTMIITMVLMYFINEFVVKNQKPVEAVKAAA